MISIITGKIITVAVILIYMIVTYIWARLEYKYVKEEKKQITWKSKLYYSYTFIFVVYGIYSLVRDISYLLNNM